jgi:hypothetical protein
MYLVQVLRVTFAISSLSSGTTSYDPLALKSWIHAAPGSPDKRHNRATIRSKAGYPVIPVYEVLQPRL